MFLDEVLCLLVYLFIFVILQVLEHFQSLKLLHKEFSFDQLGALLEKFVQCLEKFPRKSFDRQNCWVFFLEQADENTDQRRTPVLRQNDKLVQAMIVTRRNGVRNGLESFTLDLEGLRRLQIRDKLVKDKLVLEQNLQMPRRSARNIRERETHFFRDIILFRVLFRQRNQLVK